MTTQEMLTLAAKAMGYESRGSFEHSDCSGLYIVHPVLKDDAGAYVKWRPLTNSGDAAEMCAALGIDTVWRSGGVLCSFDDLDIDATEYWESHHGDRAAAWRLAAVRVASEIGRAM